MESSSAREPLSSAKPQETVVVTVDETGARIKRQVMRVPLREVYTIEAGTPATTS